ncbi:reverse transcriptase family protein [Methylocapsa sp. S129]|uniref:reverse transcriptase family protein n=1 Tax=Methylocapsa sp. S129 TaxID=1641869 RepID=UPI00131B581C|nr:reverse transcriptase family protein [Methylocapsa sp. S129]
MEFPLHAYLNHLQTEGASGEFIAAVRRNAKPLADRDLPVILTLGHLAYATDVRYGTLNGIVRRQIDPYRVFAIRKRNGGKRSICVPEPGLLSVQRWIHEHILCSHYALSRLSNQSTAYAPGCSHLANARRHISAAWLLKLDITRFFESISERQVYRVFRGFGYRALVAFFLTRLCTRVLPFAVDRRLKRQIRRWRTGEPRRYLNAAVVGHLPQGAPTSPMLANFVCTVLDAELQTIAVREGLTYTRYADDMTFSGGIGVACSPAEIIREISTIVGKFGFGINSQKTSIAKNGSRKIVTGLSVEGDMLRLPRSYKDELRQELFFLKKYGIAEHCSRTNHKNHMSYLLRLAGRIRYAVSAEPIIGTRMMLQFQHLFPNFTEIEQSLFDRP